MNLYTSSSHLGVWGVAGSGAKPQPPTNLVNFGTDPGLAGEGMNEKKLERFPTVRGRV